MTDRAGYSLVSIEQKAHFDQELFDAVCSNPAVQNLSESECIRLNSGDGIALVSFTGPILVLEGAIRLHETVAKHSAAKPFETDHQVIIVPKMPLNPFAARLNSQ